MCTLRCAPSRCTFAGRSGNNRWRQRHVEGLPEALAAMEPICSAPVPCTTETSCRPAQEERPMNGIIYLVGLIVVIMFILSFLGLR
jgi:hypothetical protein